jgi:hypothetical protein
VRGLSGKKILFLLPSREQIDGRQAKRKFFALDHHKEDMISPSGRALRLGLTWCNGPMRISVGALPTTGQRHLPTIGDEPATVRDATELFV